jgi:predicted molibdopterin-dependent oxidoreductase YjgC
MRLSRSRRNWRESEALRPARWCGSLRATVNCACALVSDRVHNGQLYMPMNSTENPVNVLTGSHADPVTHTPGYKETAVKLEILAPKGESPLPRINHRFGHATPQRGVEVERKWSRSDYRFPGNELIQIERS